MAEAAEKKLLSVVLLGATGVTGKYVLGELLSRREDVQKVITLGRRKATEIPESFKLDLEQEEQAGRIEQHIVDFENITLESGKQYFEGHWAYVSCFGTTRRDAGSSDAFTKIDYGYNLKFAEIAKAANVNYIGLMSTKGANASSWFLYMGSKGKLENAVSDLKVPITSIFRPTLLDRKDKARAGEKVFGYFIKTIGPEVVARSMVKDLIGQYKNGVSEKEQVTIFENAYILENGKAD